VKLKTLQSRHGVTGNAPSVFVHAAIKKSLCGVSRGTLYKILW